MHTKKLVRNSRFQDYEQGNCPIEQSGWVERETGVFRYGELTSHLEADVLVVGAGLAGSALSLYLAELDTDVVVIEAEQPAFGASGRNAGHICPYLRHVDSLEERPFGKRFVDFFIENKDIVFETCSRYSIQCDASRSGYLDVARTLLPRSEFERTQKAWRNLGYEVEAVFGNSLSELTGTKEYKCGLYWREGGRVNPYLFTNGMIKSAISLGVKIFGDSPAVHCDPQGGRWLVRTPKGSVLARKVIFCTNGHKNNVLFPELATTNYPLVACGISTKPISHSLRKKILPSGAAMMQFPAGLYPLIIDSNGRLITAQIPKVGLSHNADIHFSHFINFLHRAYPQTRDEIIEIDSYWTGQTANTSDDYPKIYHVADNILALANLCSWGNHLAPLLGKNLAESLIEDRMDNLILPIEKISPVKSPKSLEFKIRNLLMPVARFADRLGII